MRWAASAAMGTFIWGRRFGDRTRRASAETDNNDDNYGAMEALSVSGDPPNAFFTTDMENGMPPGPPLDGSTWNNRLPFAFATMMLRSWRQNYTLKGGDAQSGVLVTMFDGTRPSQYVPMRKQGAIILGIGGDNSNKGQGVFFEGAIAPGLSSDALDDQIQANIAAVGYGAALNRMHAVRPAPTGRGAPRAPSTNRH